jgi:prepilin peptidase dependent protein B
MRVNTVRNHPRPRAQRGLSIIEFMVGVTIGLFIVTGASKLLIDNLSSNRRLLIETRLNQDLRAAADIIARDLRRSGYWVNATSGVWGPGTTSVTPNAYAAAASSTGASVTYAYARDANDVVDSNEQTGFRLATVSGVGVLQVLDGAAGWTALTDPATMNITAFTPTLVTYTRNLSEYCNCLKLVPVSAACVVPFANPPTLTIRRYEFVLTGASRADSSVVRTINETVRVRNDQLSGICPA